MPYFDEADPRNFGWNYPVSPVPFTWRGTAFPGGVHHLVSAHFSKALEALARDGGMKLHPGPPDVAGTWGYEDRSIRGGEGLSFHAFGLALDVNAPWNPQGASPPEPGVYRMPENADQILRPLGILWGGSQEFRYRPDWMHLELHLSPREVGLPPTLDRGFTDRSPFPLPPGCYYGPFSGPPESISGVPASDRDYRPGLAAAQTRLHVVPDGIYGQVTAAALKRFQQGKGLTADGLLGPLTWAALFHSR